jgi:hypothetical protein
MLCVEGIDRLIIAYERGLGGPGMVHACCWSHYPESGIIPSESIGGA